MTKPKNLSDYLIAAAVIGCSGVLLAVMTIALTGWEAPGGQLIKVDMPTVAGVRKNSDVRYAGAHVGKIIDIRPLAWNERSNPDFAVRITAKITEPMPALKTDSMAAITSDSILAEKFLDLSPGSKDAPDLPPGQPLYCRDVASFDDLSRAGMNALDKLNAILAGLEGAHNDLPAKLNSFITNTDQLARNADSVIAQIDTVLRTHPGELDKSFDDMRVILQNLKVVSTYSKTLGGVLARRPWHVVWGSHVNEIPTENQILENDKPIPAKLPKD